MHLYPYGTKNKNFNETKNKLILLIT